MKKNKIKIIKNNCRAKCYVCKTWQTICNVKLQTNEYRMNICQSCKEIIKEINNETI